MKQAVGTARHYAVRRVNPFRGVLQVVEIADARAYSTHGDDWQIQVLARRPDTTWRSFGDMPAIEQYFHFGLWDSDRGLHGVRANPVLDIGRMNAAAERLAHALRPLVDQLPFPLVDAYECWSTDHRGAPVALLATTEQRQRLDDIRPSHWQATQLSDHGFVSAALLERGVPAANDGSARHHAERLERQVRRLGQRQAWFERSPSGAGRLLQANFAPDDLPADAFPPLGLKSHWEDPETQALAADYFAWQAPRLLTLQGIDDQQRRYLEGLACRRAVELSANYRLIPRILDKARIEAARVEARLRVAAS